jgi:hypothetical protein
MPNEIPRARRSAWPRIGPLLAVGLLASATFSFPSINLPGVDPDRPPEPPRCPTCQSPAEWKSKERWVAMCTRRQHRFAVRGCDQDGCSELACSLHGQSRTWWRCAEGHRFQKRLCPHCWEFADRAENRWWRCRTSVEPIYFAVYECKVCARTRSPAYAVLRAGERLARCELVDHEVPIS